MTALSILIYHRVLARPDPLFPEQVDARIFERQMVLLKRFFRVLAPSEALRRLRDGSLPRRAACITFDDGYADNRQLALPLLQKHGLQACFFIASGYLDGGRMWNDSVIEGVRHAQGPWLDLSSLGHGRLAVGTPAQKRQTITALLAALKYLPNGQRQAAAETIYAGATHAPAGPLMMSSADIRALHGAGMEIGGHTVSHPILATLSDFDARAEIGHGKAALENLIDAPLRLFAYPNGKPGHDYSARDVALVRNLGFEAALATQWGAARPHDDPFQLPRFTPWDQGRLRFLLRLEQKRWSRA